MRSDALAATSTTAPEEYQQQIQLTRDIANVLKRNVVQAAKVDCEETNTWSKIYFSCRRNTIDAVVV